MKTVVVLGASDKPERTSNKAIKLLLEKGFRVIPVHPTLKIIEGLYVVQSLDDIKERVDILSVYVKPDIGEKLLSHIADLKPNFVVLNPGSDSPAMEMGLEKHCIAYHKACTLVLLATNKL
jgi:predicted CoA-binding protein